MAVGDLRDVDKAVDAGHHPGESAESGHADNFRLQHGTDGILLTQLLPGAVLGFFITEGNLPFFGVKAFDGDVDLVADSKNLRGVLDTLPGEFGNMDHAVDAADIDKGAVAGHRFDHAAYFITDGGSCPESVRSGLAAVGKRRLDGTDGAFALLVDLNNLEVDALVEQIVKRVASRSGRQRGGYEYFHTVRQDEQAAFDNLGHDAFEHGVRVLGIANIKP